MSERYEQILSGIYEQCWYITKEGMELILSILDRKIEGISLSSEELEALRASNMRSGELELPDKPSLAILPLQGPIFPKANMMTRMSGATSLQKFKSDFTQLMDSDKVTSIILNVDSPGGSAQMVKETADVIYEARQANIKPIHAISNSVNGSAAYFLSSQADKLWATPSGVTGSIGVIATHVDESAKDEQAGLKRTILSVGKYKAEGNPYEPLGDDAKSHMLSTMHEMYDMFVESVARGRDTTVENVSENYGQGRVYRSKTALKHGMVDGVKTLDTLVSEMSSATKDQSRISVPTNIGGKVMAELTPEILARLGLSEDASTKEVEEAVIALMEDDDDGDPGDENDAALNFAAMFPEQAREIAELRAKNRADSAHLFSQKYTSFGNGLGFSALVLGEVESLHLKIADGLMTHEDLESFLNHFKAGAAIVDYLEIGSSREGNTNASSSEDAALKLRDLAYERMAEKGLSYGDAISQVMKENEDLVKMYRSNSERGEN
jgi:signal peptide peptidase SppA